MKKQFCSVLCLMLALVLAAPALADGFDLSLMRENSSLYEIDVNTDSGVAFVSSTFTPSQLSFEHKYDSSAYYSSLYNDLIVLDYFGTDSYPVWRIWVEYYGTQHIYATQVSFSFNGKKYTFSGVADSDRVTTAENGDAHETLLIKLGTDNMEFVVDMLAYWDILTADAVDGDITTAVLDNCSMTMTLSGTENITVEVPPIFMLDFYLATTAFMQGDVSNFSKVTDPTTLKITSID